jgi:predicted nuclease of predicted toxin-antitoxin system
MNLGPDWVTALQTEELHVRHWRDIGDKSAPDRDIFAWARTNGYVVLTLDLDFQQLLFATRAQGPSVVLLRVRDPLSTALPNKVRRVLLDNATHLAGGCLIVLDEMRARVRRLPLQP